MWDQSIESCSLRAWCISENTWTITYSITNTTNMVHLINHCELRLVAKFSRGRNIFWGYLSTTYLSILTKIYLNLELTKCRPLPHTSSKNIKNIFSFLKIFLPKVLIILIEYCFKLAQLNNFEIYFFKNCCIPIWACSSRFPSML